MSVPALRFPEFLAAGEWEDKTLDSCLDYLQPTPYLVSDTAYSDQYETPVLTAGKTFILGYTNEQHGIFKDNLPVIIFDDFTTATQLVNFSFKAKSSAMKILTIKNGTDIKFIYETIKMLAYEIGGHERHWISQFAPMLVLVPQLEEQQKIADCLASVDAFINTQSHTIDSLRTHKKGLMQQLFPAEDETQPRLRFALFADAGEWEDKTLDSCLDYLQPTPYLVSDTAYSDQYETPVLTAGKTFILGYTNEQHGIFKDNLPVIIFDDFTTATQLVNFSFKAKSSAMKILTIKNGNDIKFIYEAIKMLAYEIGGHERHWISQFAPMLVLVPQLEEQQKIADCLSSIDELISLNTQQLDTLKTFKKGLMQGLFPAAGDSKPIASKV
jgi:type I restriction enzyme, S subunit